MRLVYILFALLASSLAFAQAYRWVDENGVVHYSDRPVDGAEQIELRGAQTYSSPAVPASDRAATETPDEQRAGVSRYRALEIVRPHNQETLWNTGGTMTISLRLTPALGPNDRIRLIYDGNMMGGLPTDSLDITMTDVFRGQHTLQAVIENPYGQTLISSPIVSFQVQQRSILQPR